MRIPKALRRSFLWMALVVGSAAVLSILGTLLAYPAAAAAACPQCYGFRALEPGVSVERGATGAQRDQVQRVVAASRKRVRRFYGRLLTHPRILVCETEPCYARFGGRSRGKTLLDRVVVLSPRGISVVIASHELAHAQTHARIGLIRTVRGDLPRWFDEGLAVVVSNDPRYLAPEGAADRCRVPPDGPLPSSRGAWNRKVRSEPLYAMAACQVSRWLDGRGGPKAVRTLLREVAAGVPFDVAYRSPR